MLNELTGLERKTNGEKFGEGNGGPKLHLFAGSFSNVELSHEITYKSDGFWDHKDVAFGKIEMKL